MQRQRSEQLTHMMEPPHEGNDNNCPQLYDIVERTSNISLRDVGERAAVQSVEWLEAARFRSMTDTDTRRSRLSLSRTVIRRSTVKPLSIASPMLDKSAAAKPVSLSASRTDKLSSIRQFGRATCKSLTHNDII